MSPGMVSSYSHATAFIAISVTVIYGVERDGMTSRRGIIERLYCSRFSVQGSRFVFEVRFPVLVRGSGFDSGFSVPRLQVPDRSRFGATGELRTRNREPRTANPELRTWNSEPNQNTNREP